MTETYYILDKTTGGMKQVSKVEYFRFTAAGRWVLLTKDFNGK